MATAAVDVLFLSGYLALPRPTIEDVISEPTRELVLAVLEAVAAKAKEHDELKADKIRAEVELENNVVKNEAKNRTLKAHLNKAINEVGELKEKLTNEETARAKLEAELHSVQSSSVASTSEVQTLQARISSLESSNRDAMSLLDSKSSAYDKLTEELSQQHQKTSDLRRANAGLEEAVQSAKAALATAKLRESNVQQELDLLKRSNEYLETELKTKSAESSKVRREKNARIAELQAKNEELSAAVESLQRTEASLRRRLEEIEQKADQSFTRIQQLQEDAAKREDNFKKELDAAHRLAELYNTSAKTTRERLQDVQSSLDQVKDQAAEEIGRIRVELDTERSDKTAAEARVAELEVIVERLQADAAELPHIGSLPGTPSRRINGAATPTRDSVKSLSSSRLKGGLSFTQLYSEYSAVKSELESEKRRNENLSKSVEQMIEDLESKRPEIDLLQKEHERLEAEMLDATTTIEALGKERDTARKEARRLGGQVNSMRKEGELLRQQLRDLSTQVRVLLTEMQAREDSLERLDPAQTAQVMDVITRDISDEELDGMTDTARLISQRLVIFRNVRELQEQNKNLLKIVRELGEKMEGDEARSRQEQINKDLEETSDLRVKLAHCKEELKTMATRSESYLREREMFRRMLQFRGQLPADGNPDPRFDQSVSVADLAASQDARSRSQNAKDVADMTKLLKEMQSHFDTYREEVATDHRALREQAERLSREKAELQNGIAKIRGQLSLASERFEMLQGNYNLLQTENAELQKRSTSLAENAAKQDMRSQQLAEDLVESKSLVDGMVKEVANLKAEKDLWKRIESRMIDDTELLRNERNRLSGLITSMQNLQTEREQTASETRRKLETQVENYESELQTVRRKLNEATDETRKLSMRRELENQQHQKQVDDLRTGLSNTKEQLVAAQTARDHLQARVDKLSAEHRAAEERSLTQTHVQAATLPAAQADQNAEDTVSREEELTSEVAALKHDLDIAKSELASTKEQVEQYKAISQSSEEELQSLNDTYEQYRQEVDRILADKDAKIQDLERRLEEASAELESAKRELSTARAQQEEQSSLAQVEKTRLEAEISRLTDENGRYAETAKSHQEDLKAQADIAQQAQQNYEQELLKHADAAKALQDVRRDYNQLRIEVVQLRTEAEAARATLTQSESDWEETKQRYENELNEVQVSKDEVLKQNNILHKQLEGVSHEIAALRQQRSAAGDDANMSTLASSTTLDHSSIELREVINYLRRDKEIVEVQYELSKQESKRLQQQLEYAQSQLDDCRLKLDQERRAQAELGRSAITHQELLDKINELNLYRESAVTLRSEARQAQEQLAEKAKQVEALTAEMQSLRSTVQELQISKEAQDSEIALLQQDRDRWQQRTQTILQKYNQVDPAELETLKEQLVSLESERNEILAQRERADELQQQVDAIPDQIRQAQEEAVVPWRERQEKQVAQFKERSRQLVAAKNEKIAECNQLAEEKGELEEQLALTRQEIERTKAERDDAVSKADALAQEIRRKSAEASRSPQGESAASKEEKQRLFERANTAASHAREQEERAQALQVELVSCRTRIVELEEQLAQLQHGLDEANTQISRLQVAQSQTVETEGSDSDTKLESLRQELWNAQQEIYKLQTDAAIRTAIEQPVTDAEGKTVAEQVSEQVDAIRNDLDQRHAERVQQAEDQFKQRADRMKIQLSKRLMDGKDQIRQTLESEYKEEIEKLTRDHEVEIEALRRAHKEELQSLVQEAEGRHEKGLKEWQKMADEANARAVALEEEKKRLEEQARLPAAARKTDESSDEPQLSEMQLRELARTNPVLQGILRNNITTQVKKAREEQERLAEERLNEAIAKAREEQERLANEKLSEAIAKAEREKEQAVAMETQRQKVKLSMAEAKARTLSAKQDVVQTAAQETPQRPVAEVWEIAKVTRAPPATAPQAAAPAASPQVAALPALQPAAPSAGPQAPAPTPAGASSIPQPAFNPFTAGGMPPRPLAQPPQNPFSAAGATQPLPAAVASEAARQQPQPPPSRLPQAPPMFNIGTGPAALRGVLGQGQSMLPRPPVFPGRAGFGMSQQPVVADVPPDSASHGPAHQQDQMSGRARDTRPRGHGQRKGPGEQQGPPHHQGQEMPAAADGQHFTGRGGGKRHRDDGPEDGGGRGGKKARGGRGGF